MNFSTRTLGLALLFLLLFLGATITLQWWLRRETRQLQDVAVTEVRERLNRAVTVSGRPPESWDAGFRRELGAMLGGTIEQSRSDVPFATNPTRGALAFTEQLGTAPGWQVRVSIAPPALLKAQMLHQRVLAVIILLSLLLALVPLLLVIMAARRHPAGDAGSRAPWNISRAQAAGLEHLARISHERGTALAEEHGARVRAEEDLLVNRSLLGHSVAERVRLGRELHDNICQTLYAVCLTLESVQKKSALAPDLQGRLAQCMNELRRLNREVRAYLEELEPTRVTTQTFAGALEELIGTFTAGQEVQIEQRIDEDAVALIPPLQIAEIMNILREALSNSLRHGQARRLTLLVGRGDGQVALAVQDDGRGFVPQAGSPGGHGLGNMEARAVALGGSLRIESAAGKGTRVLLTLPVASPA